MRKFLKRIKDVMLSTKAKVYFALATGTIVGMPISAFAITTKEATWNGEDSVDNIIASVLGLVLGIAQGVGIILMVFGIFRLILAFKDSNSNEQAQGIQLALVGAFLVGLRTLLEAMELIS